MNLLGNLPLRCLDVLLSLELKPDSLEFLGMNMDVICALLSFLEKRLHQVSRVSSHPPAQVERSCRNSAVDPFSLSLSLSREVHEVPWVSDPYYCCAQAALGDKHHLSLGIPRGPQELLPRPFPVVQSQTP